jgi:hypothetical protein
MDVGRLEAVVAEEEQPVGSIASNRRHLWPSHFGRQRHEDRLDIAAGLEAEEGAAVVEQVEFDIAAAAATRSTTRPTASPITR